MGRMNPTILLVALAAGFGYHCANHGDVFANDAFATITFRVLGMKKAKSGAT